MHSIITVVDVKIYITQKYKRHTLKITPTCFGSHRIHHQGVITCTWLKLHTYNYIRIMVHVLIMCVVGVWRRILDLWCVCTLRRTENYCIELQLSVKYRLSLSDDGSYVIRNMLD